ncbi:uncharacterized protein B0P05DRAFT_522612, partial [Gilbertella persicaria]|uniref:Uncharacterized protein n=1 Tax=Rhizopus stolonifer TaxID=4846 RepID=A0A367IPH1_RHIST
MDLSWCIICDRHCIDNNLYCSEACKFQDMTGQKDSKPDNIFKSPSLVSPPTSPVLSPFLYSFQPSHDRLRSAGHITRTSHHYQYTPYQFVPSSPSESSLYGDDT